MSIDTIGNFLTVIRNGTRVAKPAIVTPYSRFKHQLSDLLKQEGFVRDVLIEGEGVEKSLKVLLKYKDGESVIHEIKRISVPGRRVYQGSDNLKPVISGLGVAVLTTNRGIITDKQARELGVGGEVICTVW